MLPDTRTRAIVTLRAINAVAVQICCVGREGRRPQRLCSWHWTDAHSDPRHWGASYEMLMEENPDTCFAKHIVGNGYGPPRAHVTGRSMP